MKKQKTRPHSITFTQPTLTQQHSKDEVDINKIMARYIKTGVIDHVAKYQGQYTDNNETDYHTSQNILIKADAMFAELPATVRKNFDNDPASFLQFVSNEENHSKLQEMGLTNTPPSPLSDNTPATDLPVKPTKAKAAPGEPAPADPGPASTP